MEKVILEPIFPSLLFITKLEIDNIEEIKKDIIENHKSYVSKNKINDEMTPYGENAFTRLEFNPKYKNLIESIERIIDRSLKESLLFTDLNCYVSAMWSTCTCPGESGEDHYHSNSYFSGVFYPFDSTPSQLRFYSPNHENYSLNVCGNINTWNPYNSASYDLQPQKNNLIFFPSYLKHRVLKNNSNIVRYSLAFNIYLRGTLKAETSNLILH